MCEYNKVIEDNGEETVITNAEKAWRAETKAYLLNLQTKENSFKENSFSVNRL